MHSCNREKNKIHSASNIKSFIFSLIYAATLYSMAPNAAECEYIIKNEWGNGFSAVIVIQNNTSQAINGWSIGWEYTQGDQLSSSWNANVSGSGAYTATPLSWNGTISPGGNVEIGLQGTKSANQPAETPQITGDICTGISTNMPPNVIVSHSTLSGPPPLSVTFDASESSDPDGDSLNFQWDFGDGNESRLISPIHTFTSPDTYTVALEVTDGSNPAIIQYFEVTVSELNQPPIASFSVNNPGGNLPVSVAFDASNSRDPEGNTLTYAWDFGTRTSSRPMPTIRFTEAGTYPVSLTVNDGTLASNTVTINVIIDEPNDNAAWTLDGEQSELNFVSTKKIHVMEKHRFNQLSGEIDDTNIAQLIIDLDSVDTNAETRDERMRLFLFETSTYPTATISVDISDIDIGGMARGSRIISDITASVDLHGVIASIETQVRVTKLSNTRVMVQNNTPIIVNAVDFSLTGGITQLMELANLASIGYSVPTDFLLFYDAASASAR